MRPSSVLFTLCLAASSASLVFAQAKPAAVPAAAPQTFTPKSIVFSGVPAYPSADLANLLGIAPGTTLTEAQIGDALQHFADLGLFTDMSYAIADGVLTVKLKPQPPSAMLPVVYGNFVMFQPRELNALVQAKVPLFTGQVPAAGNFADVVQNALVAVLADKGIKAKVEFVGGGTLGGPVSSLVYTIASPPVTIHQLIVTPVTAPAQAKVNEVIKEYSGVPYERATDQAVRDKLLYVYQDLAFQDVAVDSVSHTPPVVSPEAIALDVVAKVHEGIQYRVSTLTFADSPLFTQADYTSLAAIKQGGLASRVLLLATTGHLKQSLESRGYFDAKVTYQDHKEPGSHTIGYAFSVDPGEQYKIKSVKTVGLNALQQGEFDQNWKLTAGSAYDAAYIGNFLRKNPNLASLQGYTASWTIATDAQAHTVEVVLTFKRGVPVR